MSKSVRISEEFHAFVAAHNRDSETMEETHRRLVGGPHPDDMAGILSSETAEQMRDRLDDRRPMGETQTRLGERFE